MSTEESADDGSTDTDQWEPKAIRQALPGGLGDKQRRALVCAIRNPDASTAQIAKKVGAKSSYTVSNALRGLLLGTAGTGGSTPEDVYELRGDSREAETYSELTEKQTAIIDFAAKHPEVMDDATYGQLAQAIQEQQGVAVGETYVGTTLRKYDDILRRRRAIEAASEAESEDALEGITSEMTVREMLEAAAVYALPGSNLDSMPEGASEKQTTLAEAEASEAEFERASERQDSEEETAAPSYERTSLDLEDGWPDVPGADEAARLPDDAEDSDVKQGQAYLGYVNAVRPFGIFVSLTNPPYGGDVSGLVGQENLSGSPDDYERLDYVVVYLDEVKPQGLSFEGWQHRNPDGQQEGADAPADDAEGTTPEVEADSDEGSDSPDSHTDPSFEPTGTEAFHYLKEQVVEQHERLEALERAIDGLRSDAVMASEMAEFGDQVEERLSELEGLVADIEAGPGPAAIQNLQEGINSQAERLDDLAAQVSRIEEAQAGTVQEALDLAEGTTQPTGLLGRVQEDLDRLEREDCEVLHYQFTQRNGTVVLELEAEAAEQEAEAQEEAQ